MKIIINFGSGNNYIESNSECQYINVDDGLMFPDSKLDIKSDIKDYSVADNSVDEILASHIAMYFRPEELQPLLKKWHGFLKPDGVLEIETSDIRKIARIISSSSSQDIIKSYGLINMFGTEQTGPHRWGWSQQAMKDELLKAGFSKLKLIRASKKAKRDFRIKATK